MKERTTIRERHRSQEGLTLIELTVAAGVLSFIIVAAGMTLFRGVGQREGSFENYRAVGQLRNFVAEVQQTANFPNDLTQQEGVGALYAKYHDQTFTVPELPSGQIMVFVFANEATVPAILGGPQDLNFDGDAADDLGNVSVGSDLKLVPMRITLNYGDGNSPQTTTSFRLFTNTAN